MTYLLRFHHCLLTLALPLGLAACSKTPAPTPAPTATTGTIEGTVSPAGAVTAVTATTPGGLTFPATPQAASGAFTLTGLAPGSYSLSFMPASGYATPAARTMAVVAGQTVSAGTVAVVGDGTPRGTISWTVNGVTYTTTNIRGLIKSNSLDVSAYSTAGTTTDVIVFWVYSTFVSVPAIFNLGSSFDMAVSYQRQIGGIPSLYYSTIYGGSGGIITVSSFDYNARTISGTFSCVASGYNGTAGKATVTNGTFNLSY